MKQSQSPISQRPRSSSIRGSLHAFVAVAFFGAVAGSLLLPQISTRPVSIELISRVEPDTKGTDEPTSEPSDAISDGIEECVITLLSGRKITGELVRQDSLIVVIGINGIETTFRRAKVAKIDILPPIDVRYQEMRSAINDDDLDARLTLVEWLRSRKAYQLALSELESILIDAPENRQAQTLFNWLSEYNKLTSRKPVEPASDNDAQPSTTSAPRATQRSRAPKSNNIVPLNQEQINLIRVYEIDLRNPPKIIVPDETLRTLMLRNPDAFSPNENERQAIFDLSDIDKLKILFTHKARDLYTQVQVLEDPETLEVFKRDIHAQRGWLVNSCATMRCHGGTDAGRFQLINTKPNSNETAYTNFYIIEHYIMNDGSPLINFESPERSPLLQMGMMRTNALPPHPEIPRGYPGRGWRAIFRSTRDRNYRKSIEWIRSMYQPRPNYGFEEYSPFPPATPSENQPEPPKSP